MQSEMPFFESVEDALSASVNALGGAKVVGSKLWPDKSIDAARTLLLDCLNASRKEKLEASQIIFIFREAKAVGFHAGFNWFANQCEYDARPITKAEEVDRLTTIIEQSGKTFANAVALLEKMQGNTRY